MARFTAGVPVNFTIGGITFRGPAGTEFELPDELVNDVREYGAAAIPGFAWVREDDFSWLEQRVAALEQGGGGGGGHPNLAAHDLMGLATQAELDAVEDSLVQYALDVDLVTHEGAGHPSVHAPLAHTHADGDLPAGLARDAEVAAAYQPLDSDLTAIAALSTTAFGRSLLALADAAALAGAHNHGGGGGEAFPVGSVFIAVVSTDPATLLGYGTWAAFAAGRVLVGIDAGQAEFDAVEETGGAKTHTLTAGEIPSHTHVVTSQTATSGAATSYEHGTLDTSSAEAEATEVTGATGGGGAHNNLQPYIVVYMWKRTA